MILYNVDSLLRILTERGLSFSRIFVFDTWYSGTVARIVTFFREDFDVDVAIYILFENMIESILIGVNNLLRKYVILVKNYGS